VKPLGGAVEGAEASDSPKVATAMATGDGRSRQVAAAAIQFARGTTSERERGQMGLGWVGLTDPDPSQVG
jgi:hypothetical protein